ncbi:MAG TPA: hypothetical protein VID49_12395 [Steroidobacteraceae bacterium]|jgi:hypothetical protein
MIRSTPSVAAFGWLLLAAHAYAAPATEQLQQLQGGLRQARAANDWPAYLATATKLQTFLNAAPRSLLEVSRAQLHVGNTDAALQALSQFAAMGQAADLPGLAQEFATLPQGPALQRLQERMSANARPVALGASALVLADAGLLAEDLDYDRSGKRFLVSSIRERKIVALSRHGRSTDFARSPDGWPMVALRIDAQHGRVWATEVAFQGSALAPAADWGRSALLCFELTTGTLVHRIEAPHAAALGDLVITPRGDVIASDGEGGGLYRLPAGGTALQVLNSTDLVSPQTPALHPDGRQVFVPDYVRGIAVLDLASGELRWLSMQGRFALSGIDGLYFQHGRLIAVQNGTLPERVVLFTLDPTFDHIVAETVIERSTATLGDPTHGVIVGNDFYYIANSGWDLLDEHGALKSDAHPSPPRIMRVQLPRTS